MGLLEEGEERDVDPDIDSGAASSEFECSLAHLPPPFVAKADKFGFSILLLTLTNLSICLVSMVLLLMRMISNLLLLTLANGHFACRPFANCQSFDALMSKSVFKLSCESFRPDAL